MPHSESQLVNSLVKESRVPASRPPLNPSKARNGENGEKLVVPRPPLPPKIRPKSPSLANVKKLSIPSSADTSSITSKLVPRLSLFRPKTPTNLDSNNHSNGFTLLSRNSSSHSIDSMNSSFRSISPSLSMISDTESSRHNSRDSFRSITPRRIFPQTYDPNRTNYLTKLRSLDASPTIFDGKLSFDLAAPKQRIRQEFRSSPAHAADIETASRYLSDKINDFLKRTDHVSEEWNNRCKSVSRNSCDVVSIIEEQRNLDDEATKRLARSKSVTNIMIKGYQMAKNMPPTERANSVCRIRSASVIRRSESQDTFIDDEVTKLKYRKPTCNPIYRQMNSFM